jgi:uncharacterized protein involved in exopolysaccharide biosynthesis
MTPVPNNQTDRYEDDDEIDLKAIFVVLLQQKWWILGGAILFAVIAFVYSYFVLPREYSAAAFVIITKPSVNAVLDEKIESVPQTPDARSLLEMTRADDLVLEIYQAPPVQSLLDDEIPLAAFKNKLEISLLGTTQFRLQATDTDPQRAAVIANVWAERVTVRLNKLFGTDLEAIQLLQTQADQALEAWDAAEQALIQGLPENQLNALQIRQSQAETTLKDLLNQILYIDNLLLNIQILQSSLATQPANQGLPLGDAMSLISLQQQAVGQLEGIQIQIANPETLGEQITVTEARSRLDGLSLALENRQKELESEIKVVESNISALITAVEIAQFQLTQLRVQRNLRQDAYQALSSYLVENNITLSQNSQPVKIAGLALPPNNPSGPSAILYTAVAGAAGFGIMAIIVLFLSWWKSPAISIPHL